MFQAVGLKVMEAKEINKDFWEKSTCERRDDIFYHKQEKFEKTGKATRRHVTTAADTAGHCHAMCFVTLRDRDSY